MVRTPFEKAFIEVAETFVDFHIEEDFKEYVVDNYENYGVWEAIKTWFIDNQSEAFAEYVADR